MQRLDLQKDRRCVTASLLEKFTTKSDASILLVQKRCPISDLFCQESRKNVKIDENVIDGAIGGRTEANPVTYEFPPQKKDEEHSFG